VREIILKPVLTDDQLAALDNEFLTPAHCVEPITTSTIARTTGGQIQFIFVRNVFGPEIRDLAETNIGRIGNSAKQSNRAAVRGEQGKEAVWGFMEASKFRPEAGMTALTAQHIEKFINALPFFEAVADKFRLYWPEAHSFQQQMAARAPEFVIPNTIYSTITINSGSLMTRAHTDDGNAVGTVSCLATLGKFTGGHICLPRFGVLIENNPGDLLIADIREELHGNIGPIFGERIAHVFYLRGGCSLRRRRSGQRTASTPRRRTKHD
jgi:hypothetical protein